MRTAAVVGLLAALLAATASSSAAGFDRGTATVAAPTKTARVVLHVEIARTRAQRERGLMGRRTLGAKAGMVFLYPEPHRGSFWMKDTLIPLDIAFYDGRGRILRILTMQPCRRDPCTLYDPRVAFRGALEVRAGSFRRWGVRAGDRVAVRATRSG
jgi:uncharacterized membrane protein (UPF0127 family)